MLKAFLIFCFVFSYNAVLLAQNNLVELDYLLTVTYTPEIINYRNTTSIIGKEHAYYQVDFSPKSKGSIDEDSKLIVVGQIDKKEYFSEILIDIQDSILVENTFDRRGTKEFLSIEEELPIMNWEITSEFKEVNGYQCYLALLEYRGRRYSAYFTYDIPLKLGPWKFNGLPGLIVSIWDESGIYKWELRKIDRADSMEKLIEEFNIRRQKFKKVTYEIFDRNLIKSNLDRLRILKSRGNSNGYKVIHHFTTEQWLEPSNEFRSQIIFSM